MFLWMELQIVIVNGIKRVNETSKDHAAYKREKFVCLYCRLLVSGFVGVQTAYPRVNVKTV